MGELQRITEEVRSLILRWRLGSRTWSERQQAEFGPPVREHQGAPWVIWVLFII